MSCIHKKTHNEDWPGGGIEVCDKCGMSRHPLEQGQSDWIMIENIEGTRIKLQEGINRIVSSCKPIKGVA